MTDALIAFAIMALSMGIPMLLVLAWWRKRVRHRRGLAAEVERHG